MLSPMLRKNKLLNILKYTLVYVIRMSVTTVKIRTQTKEKLDRFREYKNESYDEVITKLVYIVDQSKKDPELSKQTIHDIEKARERIRKGKFVTEKKALKRLGFSDV